MPIGDELLSVHEMHELHIPIPVVTYVEYLLLTSDDEYAYVVFLLHI
ncbi:MAG: hypothetical protein Q4B99_00535 [Clostridia bacterium]|nr:hypothetical protein [Clostridia bacterium]